MRGSVGCIAANDLKTALKRLIRTFEVLGDHQFFLKVIRKTKGKVLEIQIVELKKPVPFTYPKKGKKRGRK